MALYIGIGTLSMLIISLAHLLHPPANAHAERTKKKHLAT